MKRGIVFLLWMAMWLPVEANNVRIVKEPDIAVAAITDGIALIEMDIAWDNSWRDEFNWDAVYIFLKYKRKTETAWKHVYLMDGGHAIGLPDFEFQMAKSSTDVNKCMGIFIQRSKVGSGSVSRLSLKLRWLLKNNGLGQVDFFNDEVEYQASCIEMVYVPMGAFCLGDGISEKTFQRHHRPILPEWDCLSLDTTKMEYLALGNQVSDDYRNFPPENAVNRVNNASDLNNAWRSSESGKTFWQVHFKDRPRTIRYFGVSGLSGQARPDTWKLNGSKDGKSWTTLWQGKVPDWYIGAKSYPVQYALEVNQDKVGAYSYYQIEVVTASGYVVANNIAMTEVDLKQMTNDAFVVDRPDGIVMDMETNLSANDGDSWSGTLQANYPTGFNSFYAMKYEISQEQWVRFLNKLEYNQQKQRTIGDRLDGLAVGKYVYGSTCRNGIAIGSRDKGAVVFVNNLTNDAGNAIAQEDDGQTIACNYLSPADMLAYADWCGLRPLSEMEYEKMARPPYPALPLQKEWAGGDPALLVKPLASGLTDARKVTERINLNNGRHVNVNAGGTLGGPVRVGATAVGANNRTEAGAGFWGCLDLSGNLAEIYYACNNNLGRNFHDILQAHGDGELVVNTTVATAGNTNMSTSYWPQDPRAFILRGGHFQSQRDDELAISDRSKYAYFSNLNAKDSLSTFRLGHSVSKLNPAVSVPKTYLTLVNGGTSVSNGSAKDSVCSEAPYLIRGTDVTTLPEYDGGRYSYIWYKSENGGTNWEIIQGEEGCNLTYRDFFNGSGTPITVLFKRRTLTPTWADDTKYVEIKVINTGFTFNRLRDTITMANHVLGYWVDTKTSAQFIWKWRSDKGDVLMHVTKGQITYDYYAPLRKQYGSQIKGKQRLVCEMNFMGRCVKKQELELVIVPRPTDGVASTNIAINASKPEYECGAVMKDVRTNTGKPELYKTVRIGDQCWMAENLRYPMGNNTRFSEYDPSGEVLGAYYPWNATVRDNACPAGWRVPNNSDFSKLTSYLEQQYGGNVGIHVKQGAYWNYKGGKQYLGDNRTGFGMPGSGYFYYGSSFQAYAGNDGMGNHYTNYSYLGSASNYYYYGSHAAGWLTHSWYWTSHNYYFPIRCIKN